MSLIRPATPPQPDTGYLRMLMLLLVSATFFEGYDGTILSLLLDDIHQAFPVGERLLGLSRGLIELGLFFAFFLARLSDRIGRRPLLVVSVLGYTLMTAATALSWDLWSFTIFQMLARVFLGTEYAVAVTIVVEEFPAHRRGRAVGRLLMFGALGDLTVALLLALGAHDGPLGWRLLFALGVVPLLAVAWLRRRLRETRRFTMHRNSLAAETAARVSMWEPWRPAYRRRLLLVGTIHLLRSLPLFAATSWFFYYAERERGVDETMLYTMFLAAFGVGLLGYGACGRLMERIGRRRTATLYLSATFAAGLALFQVTHPLIMAAALVAAIFFGIGTAPVLAAIATEPFPTGIRNSSAAWARNVFEIAGYILGPLLVGVLGDRHSGVIGSIGDATSVLMFLLVPAAWLAWRHLPETRGKELEDIQTALAATTETPRTPA